MRRLLAAGFAIVLGGCMAAQERMPLAGDITYTPWLSSEAIGTFWVPGVASGDSLNLCAAQAVINRSVTLQDSAGSHFGAFTGKYYETSNTREAGGGAAVLHESAAGIVAQGVTSYQASALVKRAVRYTLTIKAGGYLFSNIEQAQMDTGVVANSGFNPVGAWVGADPDKAIRSLEAVAQQVEQCIR